MSEIEEGDQVVTPRGNIKEWNEFLATQTYLSQDSVKKIKVDQPIRVRVSREKQAEDLVALARECGFEFVANKGTSDSKGMIIFKPSQKQIVPIGIGGKHNHDLTYAQDLPQIEAWLGANAESGDECDRCDGDEIVREHKPYPKGFTDVPCPDCTDESEDYSEPWCERETHHEQGTPEHRLAKLSFFTQEKVDDYSGFEARPFELFLMDHIDNLESELQDVREERDEVRDDKDTAMQAVNDQADVIEKLNERIEEADDKLEEISIDMTDMEIGGKIVEVRKILSPDSDDGDGE